MHIHNFRNSDPYCKIRYGNVLGIFILMLLSVSSFSLAGASENVEIIAEEEVKKKSPIKIGGAMRANYVYGTYTDGRGDDNGDVDLEILRVNQTLTLITSLVD